MLTYLVKKIKTLWWGTIFYSFRNAKWIAVTLAPQSFVKKMFVEKLNGWGIYVTEVEGEKYDKSKYSCKLTVHNPRFYKRVVINHTMGLGESYMENWWTADELTELMRILVGQPRELHRILNNKYLEAANDQGMGEAAQETIDLHYNLGNDLYEALLDKTMNYTCAWWTPGTDTLEEAQIRKMKMIAEKMQLKPGMKVMDIGCGFGATAKYIAENYGVSVTGYNLSKEQIAWARKNCEGLDVTFIQADYRTAQGQYDAIYSIGFFEHVGHTHYHEYYEVLERCLKPSGLSLLHTMITAPNRSRGNDWGNKYCFPGGEIPFPPDVFHSNLIVEDFHNMQKCYVRTLQGWLDNWRNNWHTIEHRYGHLLNGGFYRMFEFYLAGSHGFFNSRSTTVCQLVYAKKERNVEYWSIRPMGPKEEW